MRAIFCLPGLTIDREECSSYKVVQFKTFCLPVGNRFVPAGYINETLDQNFKVDVYSNTI